MKMKKFLSVALAAAMTAGLLAGAGRTVGSSCQSLYGGDRGAGKSADCGFRNL